MPDASDADALTRLYFERVTAHMRRILDEERDSLDAAATRLAEQIAADRLVYVYGPGGHSNLAAQEIFFRAGGLMHVSAILDEGTLLSNGALRSMAVERTPGYGRIVVTDNRLGEGDVLLLTNAYGINAALIDAALEARARGVFVIGVTSRARRRHAPRASARHPTKQNLPDVADLTIDTKVPIGDALVEVPGMGERIAAVSTFANAFRSTASSSAPSPGWSARRRAAVWRSGNAPAATRPMRASSPASAIACAGCERAAHHHRPRSGDGRGCRHHRRRAHRRRRPGAGGRRALARPGLVDLQVNGYAGLDLNGETLTPATVVALRERLAQEGVTSFAPTLITASEAAITAALAAIAAARRQSPLLAAMIPFIHVEGPAVSPADGPRGAHPAAHVRPPSLDEFRRWQAAADGLVGLVTLSPEWPEAMPYIAALAGGRARRHRPHRRDAGAGSCCRRGRRAPLHPSGQWRCGPAAAPPSVIWAQLADDRLTAGFIADGHHLPADTLKAMLRAKTLERAILVSDAAALGGLPAGRYASPIGGDVEVGADGRLGIAGTPYLAGAGHLLSQNVATLVNRVGLSLADALRLATRNPGAFAGGGGARAVGARADLIRFRFAPGDRALAVTDSFVADEEAVP